jgi:hypothetical protein
MSWHYSQALVAAYSAANCSGGEPCAPLNSTPTPEACSWPGKTTAALSPSPSGTTCEPSTARLGEAVLTWFLEAFPARTFQRLERVKESKESGPGCGGKCTELSVRFDRSTSSWKTHRSLFSEDLPWSSVTLPRWGIMRDGECWEQTPPDFLTDATESGCSLPTPSGVNGGRNNTMGRVDEWGGQFKPVAWDSDWLSVFTRVRGACDGLARNVDRTDAIRNGQVPAVVRLAWHTLTAPRS